MTLRKIVILVATLLVALATAAFIAVKVNEVAGSILGVAAILVALIYQGWQTENACSRMEDAGHLAVIGEVEALTQRLRQRNRLRHGHGHGGL